MYQPALLYFNYDSSESHYGQFGLQFLVLTSYVLQGSVSVRWIGALAAANETDRGSSSVIAAASSLPAAPWSPGIHGRVVKPSMHLTSEVPVEPLLITLRSD